MLSQTDISSFQEAELSTVPRYWMWLFPILFLIHDGEEAIYIWANNGLPKFNGAGILSIPQGLAAIGYELAIFIAVTYWASSPRALKIFVYIYSILVAAYVAHGFFHLIRAYDAGLLTMGTISALPFVIVAGFILYLKIIQERLITKKESILIFILSIPVIFPLILSAYWFAEIFS